MAVLKLNQRYMVIILSGRMRPRERKYLIPRNHWLPRSRWPYESEISENFWRVVVKALTKLGYQVIRQKGSYLSLKDPINPSHKPVIVPLHKSIKPELLRRIIKDADLSVEEFIELLVR